jgi:dihydroorotase
MTYELLIKGGTVVDPAQGLHGLRDIGIDRGIIVALDTDMPISAAEKVIDAEGVLVTPGLVDMHTHVAEAIMPIAVTPDEAGVFTGVTTVCDAGSTGYANFSGFQKLILPQAKTDILCFLHMSPTGQAVYPEIGWQHISHERMLKIIDENRQVVKGIKIRANREVIEKLGIDVIKSTKEVGTKAGLPIAVHIGIGRDETLPDDLLTSFNQALLNLLDEGDILVHVFTHRVGAVIKADGSVLPELKGAMERGVVLDAAPAQSHFSFDLARMALDQGILPTTISTDITVTNYQGPVLFSLPVVMSKFLALGMSLDQVIERTTINPARVLGEEHQRGSLNVGNPADISLLELTTGDFVFSDGTAGNTLQGEHLLVPKLTLKGGVEIATRPRFKNYVEGEQMTLTQGT